MIATTLLEVSKRLLDADLISRGTFDHLPEGLIITNFEGVIVDCNLAGLRLLRKRRPDALVVSCALTLFLPGVSRLADAAHGEGVPVIAGGRAFQGRAEVALRIGADAYAGDAMTALEVLTRWRTNPPTFATDQGDRNPEASLLEVDSIKFSWRAMDELRNRFPAMAFYSTRQLDRTAEDLRYMVRFAAASLWANDPTVFTEFLTWLVDLLQARSVPKQAVIAGLESLLTIPEVRETAAGPLISEGLLFLT